jgi:hypothetical protein
MNGSNQELGDPPKYLYRGAIVTAIVMMMVVVVVATNPNLQKWRDHIHVHYGLKHHAKH